MIRDEQLRREPQHRSGAVAPLQRISASRENDIRWPGSARRSQPQRLQCRCPNVEGTVTQWAAQRGGISQNDPSAAGHQHQMSAWQRFQHGVCVVAAKRWNRSLDRADADQKAEDGVPLGRGAAHHLDGLGMPSTSPPTAA